MQMITVTPCLQAIPWSTEHMSVTTMQMPANARFQPPILQPYAMLLAH